MWLYALFFVKARADGAVRANIERCGVKRENYYVVSDMSTETANVESEGGKSRNARSKSQITAFGAKLAALYYTGETYSDKTSPFTLSGDLTLTSCTFKNCAYSNGDGGCVYHDGLKDLKMYTYAITVTDCVFNGCSASRNGGCIYTRYGSLTVRSTRGVNCHANCGGCLHVGYNVQALVEDGCYFSSCYANAGGAIDAHSSDMYLTVGDCSFYNCSACGTGKDGENGGGAGAIRQYGCWTWKNCLFELCTSAGIGAALASYASEETIITNCTFKNCRAGTNGGGIGISSYFSGGLTHRGPNIKLTKITCTGCTAGDSVGQAIYIDASQCTFSSSDLCIKDCGSMPFYSTGTHDQPSWDSCLSSPTPGFTECQVETSLSYSVYAIGWLLYPL